MAKTINDLELKEACVQAARDVIAEQGVEGLSMRDVARRLDISHQAPYRHFPSRDYLLAEIMRRCFEDFANFLDVSAKNHLDDELRGMGDAYMSYAAQKPLEYRLMFGTPWPEPAAHPELVKHAVHAFDVLRQNLLKKNGHQKNAKKQAELEAMFIWSALHGLATIEQSNVMQHLVLSEGVQAHSKDFMMFMIQSALASGKSEEFMSHVV
ncbi:MAG: TetR/AcrR family transcriptional regulator [Burkholderiaceae bacterium]|jgi:AcrR family transcriptional regulator|uniref:TetR/AcrR family transcriptional regulator n=1 Tax=Mariniflexile sp. TaxID=1979402 RepID=UPI00274B9835|nr:TetR/AcrR family transcriptional regulator [Burkholderiaceae bacterium]